MSEEMVDFVDEHDQVVGVASRSVMRRDRLRHRAVFIVVRSSAGDVLIHRRSGDKDLWPGRWDLSVGGVVAAAEAYCDAARRELWEEVGVDLEPIELGRGSYDDDDVSLLARMYSVTHDGPFAFNDGEVAEAFFENAEQLFRGRPASQWVPDSMALVRPMGLLAATLPES